MEILQIDCIHNSMQICEIETVSLSYFDHGQNLNVNLSPFSISFLKFVEETKL